MPELPPPPSGPPSWRPILDAALARLPSGRGRVVAIGGLIACLALGVVAWRALRPTPVPIEASLPRATAADNPTTGTPASTPPGSGAAAEQIVVNAAGAVTAPGVYRLLSGSRVVDLIDAAGGPAPDADLDQLNLAAPLSDGDRVYVPRAGELVPASGGPSTASGAGAQPLDLNAATVEQLDALPGVGPSTAQAIVDYRTQHGRIRSVDELLEVRGIGPAKLESIRPRVRVNR